MVGQRAPGVSHWDDDDYGHKLPVFCGKRRLPAAYIHIDSANIQKMFGTNPDPEVPQHGLMAIRYKNYIDEHTAFGPDEEELYYQVDPEQLDDRAANGKTMGQLKKEAFKLCLIVTTEDDAFLHAVAKNILANRLRWDDKIIAEYIVKDALGIDVSHPHYNRCRYSAGKNRDTWQNRILDTAFDIALRIYTSDYGKIEIQPKYTYFTYDVKGDKKRWLVPPDLLQSRALNLVTAKKVFYPCMESIDETKLVKANGKPTAFGKCLMYKAFALVQFEMVYIIAKWTNKITGVYNKEAHNGHARDLSDYFPYLAEIDMEYLFKEEITGTTGTGEETTIEVARLYPMDRNKTYGKSRRKRKHFEMNIECDNKLKMSALNDDSD
ncbi:hypothetical protein BJ508DRAFT_331324 [Ascobolus immersus RN42]|uniref:Uncharacterized protein n=1 Tax=Ascobolus immersus RN42 TaxID=1160509 RepID=A0A3N4HQZ2_ASCIM|nr:hypothetical protein BJ508DRAFT_331324 [Ascobolus immersus RN42]